MSTLKVDSLVNGGKTIDFTYNAKVSNGTLKKEYYEQSTEPAYPCDGALWFNTSDDTFHVYANGGWYATTANQVVIAWYGARGVISLGATSAGGYRNTLEYITIATTGNATDFGDLTVGRHGASGVSNGSRIVYAGGNYGSAQNVLDYITVATTGNAIDFGDLSVARHNQPAGVSNGTRGVFAGGSTDNIEYITIATTGNGTDFGDLANSSWDMCGWSTLTRGVIHLGYSGGITDTLEYITIATPGNTTDFGNLTVARIGSCSCGSTTRMLIAGGRLSSSTIYNTIDYVTMGTTGNATDFGDLTSTRYAFSGAVSNTLRGVFSGGYQNLNTMDYVTIATTGNATDFGDLSTGAYTGAAASGT